jgi:hypothetical protein
MTEELKADIGDWETDMPPKSSGNTEKKQIDWFKTDKPQKYEVRLVGKHVKFKRHWSPFAKSVITHDSYKDLDPAWQAGFYPRQRFAIHVIDRADGKVKVYEFGPQVFKVFKGYKEVNGIDPSSAKEGPDFVIDVEWPGGDKSSAKYNVQAKARPAPLTDDEKVRCKENIKNLPSLFKITPLETIVKLWEEIPAAKKVPKKREDFKKSGDSAPEKAAPPPPAVVEDDPFEASGSDSENEESW